MAEGLARVAGASLFIDCPDEQGKPTTYELSPMTLGDFALVEQEYVKHRKSPMQVALPLITELGKAGLDAQANFIASRAYEDMRKWAESQDGRPSMKEIERYLDTFEGVLFTIWVLFRKNHPTITREHVRTVVEHIGTEKMREMRDQVSGLDYLGNGSGADEGATTVPEKTAAPPIDPTNASLGNVFTALSPKTTGGYLRRPIP